jgi:hypothetical protein
MPIEQEIALYPLDPGILDPGRLPVTNVPVRKRHGGDLAYIKNSSGCIRVVTDFHLRFIARG